jgi:hypothetical protein
MKDAGHYGEGFRVTTTGTKAGKVYASRQPRVGRFPATWGLWRVGTGPGRAEGQCFKTLKEAKAWAAEWGHRIMEVRR